MRKIIMFFLVLVVLVISCKKEEESTYTNTPSGTDCPTTSACGCSNLNQADCNTACCAWTVGQGCGCR